LYTGKYFTGGQTINADAPYEKMPLFVKEGSIIPIGPELQYTSQKTADTITLRVYSGKDAEFTLYEDEDVNYNYEKGAFSTIKINYNEQARTITIGDRKGSFPEMLKQRVFKIIRITPQQSKGLDFEAKEDQQVIYNGKSVTIKT
jgi:alpha-D-xyloside xylohydrolase